MSELVSRVALVSSGYLPVPNVLGGAVEALDTMLIKENERTGNINFTVFSMWTPEAQRVSDSDNYKKTKFFFVKTPKLIKLFDRFIYTLARYVFRKKKLMSYRYILQRLWYIHTVAKRLSKESSLYDKILLENHATLFMILKKFGNAKKYRGKVYYHLHNELHGDFGCLEQIKSVRKVLGVSDFILNSLDAFLIERSGSGLQNNQKAVWRNCIDIPRFRSLKTDQKGLELRNEFDILSDDVVFLFSGRLTPEKGAEELLRAFIRVAHNFQHVRLVIAGAFFFNSKISSPFERHLRDLVLNQNMQKRITFTGFVDYKDMPAVYAMSDVCVLPSVWNDPAPLAVIEAMGAGKPLITTNSGGIPEYVDDSAAIVLDRNDQLENNLMSAMSECILSVQKRDDMGNHAYELAQVLDSKNYLQQLTDILQND